MAERRGRVLVVGSLNADLTVRTRRLPGPGETVTGSDLLVSPGGKSSNQAAAAALLGGEVKLLGRVGDDANGAFLLERARAAGVDATSVERLERVATGTAVIAVDDAGENWIIVSPGANGHLTADDVTRDRGFFAGGTALCLCLEVGPAAVQAAAQAASEAGVQVLLNPSPFRPLSEELLRLVAVLIVNEHELVDLVGRDALGPGEDPDWTRVGEALAGRGPRHVVVTLGAAGAVLVSLEKEHAVQVHREPAPQVRAVDTTGCGDAFFGALAHRVALGEDPVTAGRYAVRVGAFAATRPGAQTSYPTPAELDRFTASLDGEGQAGAPQPG